MPPERIDIAPGLNISRVITGLWQVADQERQAGALDRDKASDALLAYIDGGFDTFDMADHYGSAELIAGTARARQLASTPEMPGLYFTKWCPEPHQCTREAVRAGIGERAERLQVERIDLLQLHWWSFHYPGYLDVMDELDRMREEGRIAHVGVTNFDTDHLHVLLSEGYGIVSNQVSASLIDRRAFGDMTELCLKHNVKLLAYGTLAGGFLSERWLGRPEPDEIADWSKMKYKRFIDAAGGWRAFQALLAALDGIARRHGISIANIATRWVLDQPAVGAVIIGARITERDHREGNSALFSFQLDDEDRALIDEATDGLEPIPGDCGSEYRKPPFLTASGDLSDHLDSLPKLYERVAVPGRSDRWRIGSGSEWEPVCGFSRGLRQGNRILISGTTATHGAGRAVCAGDVRGQTVYILDKIAASIASLGGSLEDVVRTRIYMRDCSRWEEASRVHGRYLGDVLPANTLIEISDLVGDYDVEIEAEAIVAEA